MKLFKVTLRGFCGSDRKVSFVVAKSSNDAYMAVLISLANSDIGFHNDREMKSVELVADDARHPSCGARLFINNREASE